MSVARKVKADTRGSSNGEAPPPAPAPESPHERGIGGPSAVPAAEYLTDEQKKAKRVRVQKLLATYLLSSNGAPAAGGRPGGFAAVAAAAAAAKSAAAAAGGEAAPVNASRRSLSLSATLSKAPRRTPTLRAVAEDGSRVPRRGASLDLTTSRREARASRRSLDPSVSVSVSVSASRRTPRPSALLGAAGAGAGGEAAPAVLLRTASKKPRPAAGALPKKKKMMKKKTPQLDPPAAPPPALPLLSDATVNEKGQDSLLASVPEADSLQEPPRARLPDIGALFPVTASVASAQSSAAAFASPPRAHRASLGGGGGGGLLSSIFGGAKPAHSGSKKIITSLDTVRGTSAGVGGSATAAAAAGSVRGAPPAAASFRAARQMSVRGRDSSVRDPSSRSVSVNPRAEGSVSQSGKPPVTAAGARWQAPLRAQKGPPALASVVRSAALQQQQQPPASEELPPPPRRGTSFGGALPSASLGIHATASDPANGSDKGEGGRIGPLPPKRAHSVKVSHWGRLGAETLGSGSGLGSVAGSVRGRPSFMGHLEDLTEVDEDRLAKTGKLSKDDQEAADAAAAAIAVAEGHRRASLELRAGGGAWAADEGRPRTDLHSRTDLLRQSSRGQSADHHDGGGLDMPPHAGAHDRRPRRNSFFASGFGGSGGRRTFARQASSLPRQEDPTPPPTVASPEDIAKLNALPKETGLTTEERIEAHACEGAEGAKRQQRMLFLTLALIHVIWALLAWCARNGA